MENHRLKSALESRIYWFPGGQTACHSGRIPLEQASVKQNLRYPTLSRLLGAVKAEFQVSTSQSSPKNVWFKPMTDPWDLQLIIKQKSSIHGSVNRPFVPWESVMGNIWSTYDMSNTRPVTGTERRYQLHHWWTPLSLLVFLEDRTVRNECLS